MDTDTDTDTDPDPDPREKEFHDTVRQYVVIGFILAILFLTAILIISYFKKRNDQIYDEEDRLVYRISMWLCYFSFATSIGSALLLPFSILTNEVLILYPGNYYFQWLSQSLVANLWTLVFLFSNLSLFIFLPFAYFFTESEGFSGSKKGITGKVTESAVALVILMILVIGISLLLALVLNQNELHVRKLFFLWENLPFLYSCVSFAGAILLLISMPIGFSRLFSELGTFLLRPKLLKTVERDLIQTSLEVKYLERVLKNRTPNSTPKRTRSNSLPATDCDEEESLEMITLNRMDTHLIPPTNGLRFRPVTPVGPIEATGETHSINRTPQQIEDDLQEMKRKWETLEGQKKINFFRRNLGFPMCLLLLVGLTGVTVLMVVRNTLEILVGIKALPKSSAQNFNLGISSLSNLGLFGSTLEVILILYLWVTAVVGVFTLPVIKRIRPCKGATSFTTIVANCALLTLLSCALPLTSRIIGVTNFDLLGEFGDIEWLGNFKIILVYNLLFATCTSMLLANTFTAPIRREIFLRMRNLGRLLSREEEFINLTGTVDFVPESPLLTVNGNHLFPKSSPSTSADPLLKEGGDSLHLD